MSWVNSNDGKHGGVRRCGPGWCGAVVRVNCCFRRNHAPSRLTAPAGSSTSVVLLDTIAIATDANIIHVVVWMACFHFVFCSLHQYKRCRERMTLVSGSMSSLLGQTLARE
jgi:hypothetical protein